MARIILADALEIFGDQSGKNEPLKEAVAAYREALKERTRDRVPIEWAKIQNTFGNVLARLGERESGTGHFEEAVAAYKSALMGFEQAQANYYAENTETNLRRAEELRNKRQNSRSIMPPGT